MLWIIFALIIVALILPLVYVLALRSELVLKLWLKYFDKNITKVTIPKSVTRIGSSAFSVGSSLEKAYDNGLLEDW